MTIQSLMCDLGDLKLSQTTDGLYHTLILYLESVAMRGIFLTRTKTYMMNGQLSTN